jgi:hypothetical protein
MGKGKRGKRKKERRKGKRKRRKKRNGEKRKIEIERKEIGKSFRKLGKIVREIRGRVFAEFFLFPGVGAFSGTAVMARWTGRRDRGVRGIPGTVADRGVGKARVGAGPGAGGAGGIRGTRAGVRGRGSD